ncbi:hypothetical protein HY095_06135 [Candidatus Micrarchaeota archaeon]|nr:hypothetical protein [Candidatus Micrarchaeota archaeon]
MPLIGGKITRLMAKKLEENNVEALNLAIDIREVTQDKKILQVNYSTRNAYEPKVAELEVEGELFYEEETEKKAREMLEEFKKTKRLPSPMAEDVVTAITYAASAVGTLGAFAIGISAPINSPRARISAAPPANLPPQEKGKAG